MAVTAKLYGKMFTALWNKEIDYDSDTINVMLTTSTYTPDQDVHDYKNDVTNEVASGGGYSTGGATLANKTVTYTASTNKHTLDADDVVWSASNITARTAVVYDNTPSTDATRPLLCYQQSDVDLTSSGGAWTLQWNASGIVEITVA
jgi:hypothetical protein